VQLAARTDLGEEHRFVLFHRVAEEDAIAALEGS
jgi:hypothetical protein